MGNITLQKLKCAGWWKHSFLRTAGREFIAGTDPGNAQSILRVTMLPSSSGIRLQFPTVLARCYQVERRASLFTGAWQSLGIEIQGTGGIIEVTESTTGVTAMYYRVSVKR